MFDVIDCDESICNILQIDMLFLSARSACVCVCVCLVSVYNIDLSDVFCWPRKDGWTDDMFTHMQQKNGSEERLTLTITNFLVIDGVGLLGRRRRRQRKKLLWLFSQPEILDVNKYCLKCRSWCCILATATFLCVFPFTLTRSWKNKYRNNSPSLGL